MSFRICIPNGKIEINSEHFVFTDSVFKKWGGETSWRTFDS